MELSDLYIFTAAYEEENLSRAAERLGYVQSNVTTRLRKLEEELGVSLFQRHPRGVVPTEKGQIFYEQVYDITKRLEEVISRVRSTSYPSGPLLIGIVETFATGRFMTKLADFQSRYPDVELTLRTGSSQELTARVLKRELDCAFITGEAASKKLAYDFEHPEEIRLVTNSSKFPDDLAKQTWVVFPKGCLYRSITEQWLKSEGLTAPKYLEIGTLETLLNCVDSGFGNSLLPLSVISNTRLPLSSHPLPEQYKYTKTSFIRHKDRFVSKALNAFLETFKPATLVL
ncbi:DNA-binding transcriptional regulator, LysR family [Paenibacillus sp. yr247]|uniref:LysR family transcriptional regulator n=1 Tax=Paenibacillus sp. yr247 TaxID=1761880 RepID=UPI0008821967|nr:LysR family transcriptional regulator [Paenibacillus sp. yr247]SDO40003.1 DNA-binding transcriptional regulator, LysR family [Paenibacillus sp. yr247]